MLWLYTTLVYMAAPVALLQNLWRARRDASYRERLAERWGYTHATFAAQPIWIHAVSVGEVQASAVLVRALLSRYPQRPLLVTTGTPTGAQRVKALFDGQVQHAFLPYDMPGAVKRFLDRARPCIGIVMETEIWPNLFRECRRRQVPMLLASARLSQKSMRSYRRLQALTRDALEDVIIEAQSSVDAERFREIGAKPEQVHVGGNLKFDIQVPPEVRPAGQHLRATQFASRPVWIAASTHEREEEAALDAHEQVCSRFPSALLILVPRHPQRFDTVRSLLLSSELPFISRSSAAPVTDEVRVLLVDTLGELQMFYAAADVAFVAGSLAPIGGHSLLEPAALHCPIVIGPHNFNAPDIARLFLEADAALQVQSAGDLGSAIITLLDDEAQRSRMTASAQAIVVRNRGALTRLLNRIDDLLSKSLAAQQST
jgi:3-deoxy-D-manno-octulosonic-acid transferase